MFVHLMFVYMHMLWSDRYTDTQVEVHRCFIHVCT